MSATFASGAKSSEEKPRYDLIPFEALTREAVRMAEGARAHGENNYQKGAHDAGFVRDRINHLLEHALKYAAGDRVDDHLAAIRCNAAMLIWIEAVRAYPEGAGTDPDRVFRPRPVPVSEPALPDPGPTCEYGDCMPDVRGTD